MLINALSNYHQYRVRFVLFRQKRSLHLHIKWLFLRSIDTVRNTSAKAQRNVPCLQNKTSVHILRIKARISSDNLLLTITIMGQSLPIREVVKTTKAHSPAQKCPLDKKIVCLI